MCYGGRANRFQKIGISEWSSQWFGRGARKPKHPGVSGACQRVGAVVSGNLFSVPRTHIIGLPTGKISIMTFNGVSISC